jgi:hypothetical protein
MPHSREHRSQGCVTVSAAPGHATFGAVAIEEIFQP